MMTPLGVMASETMNKLRRVTRIQYRAAANAVAMRLPERSRETAYQGWTLAYPSRSIVGRAAADGLIWDRHLIEIVRGLPEGSTVCEVGSNIGASLLTMARAREDLEFVCVEPSPRFFPYLRQNVKRNGLGARVRMKHVLVGPAGERWTLTSNTSTGSVVDGEYDQHIALGADEFTAVSLDSLFGPGEEPSFLKIDTDGFELRVLQSAEEMLRRALPVVFAEYTPSLLQRVGDDPDALPSFLSSVGYTVADVYHGEGDLSERNHPLTEALHTDSYVDLVVRPSAA
jgi:FkbM family methyltransferase